MDRDFKKVMSQRSVYELIIILSKDRAKYRASAIKAAEKEIKKRKIDPTIISQIKKEIELKTLKKQYIELMAASFPKRFINLIIDLLAIAIIIWVLDLISSLLSNQSNDLSIIIYIISYFGYYIYLEYKYQQTLGKLITNTIVVKLNGDKPNLSNIIERTFLRLLLINSLPFFSGEGWFHDTASKTLVINLGKKTNHSLS